MATRMQQRRGTAEQWTTANPVLAAGEIGFETDTNQFKIGDGVNLWAALSYFKNLEDLGGSLDDYILVTARSAANGVAPLDADGEIPLGFMAKLIDGANSNLNTLREIGDVVTLHQSHVEATANVHGIVSTADLATKTYANTAVTDHNTDTTEVHGIANTAALALTATVATDIATAVSTHSDDTTNVHGIVNTANLALLTDVSGSVSTHNSDTTDVHGIQDTSALATKEYADTAVSTHQADTTSVHGIANTANIAMLADVSNHSDDTTLIHGISDTANLAYLSNISDHNSDTTDVHGIADTSALATTAATASAISTAVSNHTAVTTNVHGIADTALLVTTTGTQTLTNKTITSPSGLVKADVGLGNVDNTADTAKPVSTSQASAIATAKAEAIADATSQVNALLTGAPAALNTLDELAAALGDDANFASSVTTSLGLKVDSLTPISQKSASYTLSSLTERDDLIEMGSASALTLTIPPASAVDYPIGTSIDILQTGAGQVTVAAGAGVTVNATPGLKLRTQWSSATLFKRAANTWVVFGDLTA
jgi:hypothetical protein